MHKYGLFARSSFSDMDDNQLDDIVKIITRAERGRSVGNPSIFFVFVSQISNTCADLYLTPT